MVFVLPEYLRSSEQPRNLPYSALDEIDAVYEALGAGGWNLRTSHDDG